MYDFYTDDPVADADAYYHQCDMRQAQKDEFISCQIDFYWDECIAKKGCERLCFDNELSENYPELMEIVADARRGIERGHVDKEAGLQELGRQVIAFLSRQFKDIAEQDWEKKL